MIKFQSSDKLNWKLNELVCDYYSDHNGIAMEGDERWWEEKAMIQNN